MRIGRIISVVLTATLLALCFSACKTQGGEIDTTTTKTNTTQSSTINSESFVTLKETDTLFGLVTIPEFNETMLDKESAVLANKMFADIYDSLLANIEEFKANNEESPSEDGEYPPLCTVKTSFIGTTLSVLVEYRYYYAEPKDYYVAVNFNTETGEAINPHEIAEIADFNEDEVKAALRCFAGRSLFNEWERLAFDELAETKSLPDGWGDPSYGWQDELDDMVREYDSVPQSPENGRDELQCSPTVFIDENGSFFVGANIPTKAGDGYWTTMVQIGHSDAETLHLNPVDRNGEPYRANGAITETAAFEAVTFIMGLDENGKDSNGVKYSMSAEFIDSIEGEDGVFAPAYIIKVFTDEGTHITTVSRYAVGVFTGTVWEYDTAADKWQLCPNGTGYLSTDIFTGMQQEQILAAVYNEPTELEEWCAPVVDEVDLIAYGTEKTEYYETASETALVFAKTDNTKITFVSGTMDGNEFLKQTELNSVTLDSGECVLVYMLRPEGIPSQAIIVETENDTGCDTGTYIIKDFTQDEKAKTEYITSDSAMG